LLGSFAFVNVSGGPNALTVPTMKSVAPGGEFVAVTSDVVV